MPDLPAYEVAVGGGGPAGLTTALYTTRLGHRTASFERTGGRHAAVVSVHDLLGVSEDVSGSELADGTERELLGGFAVYGREYNTNLPAALGCDLRDDGSVAVDDVTHGQNQTPVAMGDGALAGIALHKDLRAFPIDADEASAPDPDDLEVPGAAAERRARMRRDRERETHAGLKAPRPDS